MGPGTTGYGADQVMKPNEQGKAGAVADAPAKKPGAVKAQQAQVTDKKETARQSARISTGLFETFRRLEIRDQVTVVGAGLVFLLCFFPWYSMTTMLYEASEPSLMRLRGLTPWYGKLSFLACAATAGLIMLPKLRDRVFANMGEDAHALSVPILSAAIVVLGPVFLLIDTGGSLETTSLEMTEGRTIWFYIAFLAAVAATASAWWKWRDWLNDV